MKLISKKPVYQIVVEYSDSVLGTDYGNLVDWLDGKFESWEDKGDEVLEYKENGTAPKLTRAHYLVVEKDNEDPI